MPSEAVAELSTAMSGSLLPNGECPDLREKGARGVEDVDDAVGPVDHVDVPGGLADRDLVGRAAQRAVRGVAARELAQEWMSQRAHRAGGGEQAGENEQGQASARAPRVRASLVALPVRAKLRRSGILAAYSWLRRCHRDPPLSAGASRWPWPGTTWAAARSTSAATLRTPRNVSATCFPLLGPGRVVSTMLASAAG